MSEVQLYFEADDNIEQVDLDFTVIEKNPDLEVEESDEGIAGMGLQTDAINKMQQARQMMRAYTAYALSAFKDFSEAEIEEVTLKFGLKLGGKAGIPYITEGTAESNLEIQVTCKFSEKQKPSQQ
ncbi:MAG TPA: CU044_2847 family protein [Oculatellaceae cyanobacterium]|jgi:hypothetical protein